MGFGPTIRRGELTADRSTAELLRIREERVGRKSVNCRIVTVTTMDSQAVTRIGSNLRFAFDFVRRGASSDHVFRDHLRKQEVEEIVGAARLGSASGHPESAKGMARDKRSGDSAVDVEIPHRNSDFTRSILLGLRE